ncbi:MAG: SpoIIE family protein phosphatase [archaeon]|nr:SpoIIE family protein phosphatase [archaeon]
MMSRGNADQDPVFRESMRENEVRSDAALARVTLVLTLFEIAWIWFLSKEDIAGFNPDYPMLAAGILLNLVIVILHPLMKGRGIRGYRYPAIALSMVQAFIVGAYLSYNMIPIAALPTLMATLYNDRRLIALTAPVGIVVMLAALWTYNSHSSLIIGVWWGMTKWDIMVILLKRFFSYQVAVYAFIIIVAVYATQKGLGDIRDSVELKTRSAMVDRELELASSIQAGMLPSELPRIPEVGIAADMKPAREVGGDFYDCFTREDGRIVVVMADVSGKGVPAALFMMASASVLHSLLDSGDSLEDAVAKANNDVFRSNRMKYFVTLWAGIIDPEEGSLEYVNAGHNPPFIVSGGSAYRLAQKPDFIFGRRRDIAYHRHRTMLGQGDRLFLYTDGVTEARSSDGGFFGEDRLVGVLERTAGETPDRVLSEIHGALERFSEGTDQSDDITMMAVDFLGDGKRTLRVPADRNGYADLMAYVDQRTSLGGCDPAKTSELKTICSEVFANIDMHGYEGMERGTVEFSLDLSDDGAVLTFSDDGVEFDPLGWADAEPSADPRDHRNGGLGLFVVRRLSNGLSYERRDGRNILTITKEL